MHQKAKGRFFFLGRNKAGFFTYETAHSFSFISPPISALYCSAIGISYRDQTSLDLTLTSLEQRHMWDKSQHRIWASLFRFQWALPCATLRVLSTFQGIHQWAAEPPFGLEHKQTQHQHRETVSDSKPEKQFIFSIWKLMYQDNDLQPR